MAVCCATSLEPFPEFLDFLANFSAKDVDMSSKSTQVLNLLLAG